MVLKCSCGRELYYGRPDGHLMCPVLVERELAELEKVFDAELRKGGGF